MEKSPKQLLISCQIFLFCTRKSKAICLENLAVYQMSLKVFFHAPLQLVPLHQTPPSRLLCVLHRSTFFTQRSASSKALNISYILYQWLKTILLWYKNFVAVVQFHQKFFSRKLFSRRGVNKVTKAHRQGIVMWFVISLIWCKDTNFTKSLPTCSRVSNMLLTLLLFPALASEFFTEWSRNSAREMADSSSPLKDVSFCSWKGSKVWWYLLRTKEKNICYKQIKFYNPLMSTRNKHQN